MPSTATAFDSLPPPFPLALRVLLRRICLAPLGCPHRGCKDALRRVDALLHSEHHWVVDADLKSYLDTIPPRRRCAGQGEAGERASRERLMEMVKEHIADGRVLELIQAFLKAGIMEELKHYEAGESGTPQGAVMSPLLGNTYLNPLEHRMAALGYEMVRCADDFVILCQSREQAEAALRQIQQWVEAHGLTLHPQKTRIVDARERGGFELPAAFFGERRAGCLAALGSSAITSSAAANGRARRASTNCGTRCARTPAAPAENR